MILCLHLKIVWRQHSVILRWYCNITWIQRLGRICTRSDARGWLRKFQAYQLSGTIHVSCRHPCSYPPPLDKIWQNPDRFVYPQEIKYANLLFFSPWCITCLFSFICCPHTVWRGAFIEGSLEIKRPTIWTDGIAEAGRVREEKEKEERRSERRKSEKEEDAGARKNRKVAIHCVCPMICGSRGSKSNLAKAAGCGAIWPDEKWKVARRCSAKHISKSKCAKHFSFGAVLEVAMSKKCTPLWREAHF